jgi:glycosyltransferase involved in cell wall biosynthesis
MAAMKILFVTWDGPQVSYLQSLFLPLFRALQPHGVHTDVLQFRWGSEDQARAVAEQCRHADVGYRAVAVSRGVGAAGAMFSALKGSSEVRRAVAELAPDLVMPRSHMPALSVLAAGTKRLPPLCFDADGLPADERIEFGSLNASGPTFRVLTAIESAMVRRSRSVLVRSDYAASVLEQRAHVPASRFHVVTNGRDEKLFAPGTEKSRRAARKKLGVAADAPLLVYAGSVGPQYRFDLIAKTALAFRSRLPDARLLVLTGAPDEARVILDEAVLDMAEIRSAAPDQVPALLAAADLGLSFRMRSPSMRAVSPIKTAEYLLCGLPVFGTAGIGDTAGAERAGVFLDEAVGAEGAAKWLEQSVLPNREQFREAARREGVDRFSLERSVTDYLHALRAF